MKLVETLFDFLIVQRIEFWRKTNSWLSDYIEIVEAVKNLRENINTHPDLGIENDGLYVGVKGSNYVQFMVHWIKKKENGVSSRGQSIISQEKFKQLILNKVFQDVVKKIIIEPNSKNYEELFEGWKHVFGEKYNRPLLLNRAVAACETNLTSVVDEKKFGYAYYYFKEHCDFNGSYEGGWYERNIELTKWLDVVLKGKLYSLEEENNLSKQERILLRNIFVWEACVLNPAVFDLKKAVVKYGAPGTGKTFTCKQDAENHFNYWKAINRPDYELNIAAHTEMVQFHPSYTYEDFLEGIKPILVNGQTQLELTNGVFKSFCKKAAKWELEIYSVCPELQKKNWEDITVGEIKGKVLEENWTFLENVPDSEFIFKLIPPFYFIIDEINRAELSRVMGELMLCLEYRGVEGKIKTQYSNLVKSKDNDSVYLFENGSNYFFIPHNVFILATMNTIDRSVESFDFALRRRFRWEEVGVNYNALNSIFSNEDKDSESKFDGIIVGLKELNYLIEHDILLGRDFQIGHAYFMNLPQKMYSRGLDDFKNIVWNSNIKPLLEEYLRGSGDFSSKIKQFKIAFFSKESKN